MPKDLKVEDEEEDQEVVGMFQTLEHLSGNLEDKIERYSHCAVCGGYLHLTHCTDFSRNLTQEIAKCPECGVRARKLVHPLQ